MTLDALWQEFLKILCAEVGSRVVETWFKAVTCVRWDAYEKKAYLKAPNTFVRNWLETHYLSLIQRHFCRLLNEQHITIVLIEDEVSVTHLVRERVEYSNNISDIKVPVASFSSSVAHSNYHFDSFVIGPHNALACAAAQAVSAQPGTLYNPLLIYGSSGVGKTHLLHAIGNQVRGIHKQIKIIYQSADRFIHEFLSALRSDRVRQLEAKYKAADVLLMDDIQLMSRKETTQEFFFQIFNSLQQARKQIVFTSDVVPSNIVGLSDRVRTRLEGGLVTDIQAATLDARMAIIKKKAGSHNVTLHEDIAHFIAARVDSNIRDLEGSLLRVLAFASLTSQPMTIELAQRVLSHTRDSQKKVVELQQIAIGVARYFKYSLHDLRSPKRTKDLAQARHIAIYLMKRLTDRSLREIAGFLDRKDHSTIIHALDKITEQREHDMVIATLLDALEQDIMC